MRRMLIMLTLLDIRIELKSYMQALVKRSPTTYTNPTENTQTKPTFR